MGQLYSQYKLNGIPLPPAELSIDPTPFADYLQTQDHFLIGYVRLDPGTGLKLFQLSGPLTLTCISALGRVVFVPVTLSVTSTQAAFAQSLGGLGDDLLGAETVAHDDFSVLASPPATILRFDILKTTHA